MTTEGNQLKEKPTFGQANSSQEFKGLAQQSSPSIEHATLASDPWPASPAKFCPPASTLKVREKQQPQPVEMRNIGTKPGMTAVLQHHTNRGILLPLPWMLSPTVA